MDATSPEVKYLVLCEHLMNELETINEKDRNEIFWYS